jgi:hypothetical protein
VPATNAGGAVDEPLPSISMETPGYNFLKSSAHSVIRLLSVSDPTDFNFPETPDVGVYSL